LTWTLPESGQTVRYQSLSALEKGRLQSAASTKDGTIDQTRLADSEARLLAATLVDEEGHRLFSDREAGTICQWDYTAGLAELVKRIRKHCGIGPEEEKQAADFTGPASDATPDGGPPSARPTGEDT
jgi:hypothetical protein